MKRFDFFPELPLNSGRSPLAALALGALFFGSACGATDRDPGSMQVAGGAAGAAGTAGADAGGNGGAAGAPAPPVEFATVSVDVGAVRAVVGPLAFGMHASVYDNALHSPALPDLLAEAGIALLRWPGGGYSDNYHWSTHSMTPWLGTTDRGYLARGSDFGSFAGMIERVGARVMITVNYGSNLDGTGPGEPKEAAAWVAYANGDPESAQEIGVDGAGNDWLTVGHWASLRAEEPLAVDDGRNFLRISRAEPLGIQFWEIGNEVFGNGYHAGDPYELDLHVLETGPVREGHPDLSGTTYGRGVLAYIEAMKAVDPEIQVGAVLNTPPTDYSWGPDWNNQVLAEAGEQIDFAIVHWYPGRNPASLLRAPVRRIGEMAAELRRSFAEHCGENAPNVEIAMTEIGPQQDIIGEATHAIGLFAADAYLGLLAEGFFNVDWLELHNGTFLVEQTDARGPAFHGIKLANTLAKPGDELVTAVSDQSPIVAHAARRADGSVGLLLINTQPAASTEVSVSIGGAALGATGTRYDYLPAGLTSGSLAEAQRIEGVGNQFTLDLPPYAATAVVLEPVE